VLLESGGRDQIRDGQKGLGCQAKMEEDIWRRIPSMMFLQDLWLIFKRDYTTMNYPGRVSKTCIAAFRT